MGTRGLIGIKEKNKIRYIYNHFDSYPIGLMRGINKRLMSCKNEEDYNNFKEDILSGKFTDGGVEIKEIDYLFHEYVYILDFENKVWGGYKSDDSKKKLIPLLENIKFNDRLIFYNSFMVIKLKEIIEEKEHYKIYLGSDNFYYLLDRDDNVISHSKKNNNLLKKEIIDKLDDDRTIKITIY